MLGRSRGPSVKVSLQNIFADGNAWQHTQKGCGPEVAIQKCSKNCEEYSNFTGSPSLRWWFHLSTQDPTTWSANIGLRHWQERAEWDKGGESDAQVVNRFPVLLDTASASGQGVAWASQKWPLGTPKSRLGLHRWWCCKGDMHWGSSSCTGTTTRSSSGSSNSGTRNSSRNASSSSSSRRSSGTGSTPGPGDPFP